MQRLGTIVGALAVLAGTLWMLQGLGVVPGSVMSGEQAWTWIGAITAAGGLGLVGWSRRSAGR